MRTLIYLFFLSVMGVQTGNAHPLDPAYLQLHETTSGQVSLRWSGSRDFVTHVDWQLPADCQALNEAVIARDSTRWRGKKHWDCGTGLGGKILRGADAIEGRPLMLDYRLRGQTGARSTVVTVQAGMAQLPSADSSIAQPFVRFISLGIEHIALGIDHLLFVFCLLLLFRSRVRLLQAVTAFTIGHSVTLFLCATAVLQVSSAWAESCIALSLIFLCRELLYAKTEPPECQHSHQRLMNRYPWLLTLFFGLIHGMGFASALREVGIDEEHMVLRVLGFNLGIELGQLLFIAMVLSLMALVRRWLKSGLAIWWTDTPVLPYGAGVVSMFWFFQRLLPAIM
ncbi:MAG: HupE/UreJ family protein [Psychrosphaera sp.]|nr:HupE/UreJ family protein [Psychrosphaera sp.]